MSWFSKSILDPIEAAVAKAAAAGGPASAASAANITDATSNLGTALTNLAPDLATVGVNFLLSLIPGGAAFDGLADEMLVNVVNQLKGKSTAVAAMVTATTVAPVVNATTVAEATAEAAVTGAGEATGTAGGMFE